MPVSFIYPLQGGSRSVEHFTSGIFKLLTGIIIRLHIFLSGKEAFHHSRHLAEQADACLYKACRSTQYLPFALSQAIP